MAATDVIHFPSGPQPNASVKFSFKNPLKTTDSHPGQQVRICPISLWASGVSSSVLDGGVGL
jgi:hypothetical protein